MGTVTEIAQQEELHHDHDPDNIVSRILSLLVHPRLLLLMRKLLRTLRVLGVIVVAYILLGSVHRFNVHTISVLYTCAFIVLSLYVMLRLYYDILFFRHYRRIHRYVSAYWYRTIFRALVAKITHILCASFFLIVIITLRALLYP